MRRCWRPAWLGVPHPVFSEAIVAFVETRPGAELDVG